MKHLESETDSIPEQQRSSSWRRLRRWLGFLSSTNRREENGQVAEQDGDELLPAVREAFRLHAEELDEHEGGASARRFPSFIEMGPQRYIDPSIWGPKGVSTALPDDEHYVAIGKQLDDLDAADNFDGSEPLRSS